MQYSVRVTKYLIADWAPIKNAKANPSNFYPMLWISSQGQHSRISLQNAKYKMTSCSLGTWTFSGRSPRFSNTKKSKNWWHVKNKQSKSRKNHKRGFLLPQRATQMSPTKTCTLKPTLTQLPDKSTTPKWNTTLKWQNTRITQIWSILSTPNSDTERYYR